MLTLGALPQAIQMLAQVADGVIVQVDATVIWICDEITSPIVLDGVDAQVLAVNFKHWSEFLPLAQPPSTPGLFSE